MPISAVMLQALKNPIATLLVLGLAAAALACEPDAKKKEEESSAKDCEVPQDKASFKVRNGDEAEESDFPFVGMLYAEDVQQKLLSQVRHNRRICSASVVCKNVVLTAAHCFLDKDDPKPETYTFHEGLEPGEDPSGRATAPRGENVRIMSPDGATGKKDLALLKLDTDLDVEPAKLWTKSLPNPPNNGGPKITIVGYGSSETEDDKDVNSGTKRMGKMRYKGQMKTPENVLLDGMGMLHPADGVTAPTSKSQNACGGDSGGPATLDEGVYGVVAKVLAYKDGKVQDETPTCSDSNITFVAEIPRQIEWIREVMADFCSDDGKVPEYFGPSGNYKAALDSDDKAITEDLGPVDSTSSQPGESGCG